jgi:hypothetical protein
MSALYSFLSLLPPLLIGFLLVSVLWSKKQGISSDLPLKFALSIGFGFVTSSSLVFLWMMVVGRLTRGILVCELLLLAGLCLMLVRRQGASISGLADQPNNVAAPLRQRSYALRSAFCLASLSTIIQFCGLTQQYPHGQYDAFSIWNLRARFLYAGAQYWKEFAHATVDSHTDYPLLVPASVARSWELIGRETQLIPSAIALLFTFATIGVVTASISHFRGGRQGLLAGLVLLGTPFLISHGASQYADVPLAFFFAATMVLLFLHAESPSEMNFLVLAGMAAASSAWTKNEGILFLILLFFLHPLVTCRIKGKKQCATEILALLIGAVPVSVVIFIYKVCLVARNELIARQSIGSSVPKLLDASRYHLVIHWFLSLPFYFGRWSPLTAMPVLLVFYFLLLGVSVKKKEVSATSIAVLLPLFMSVGYFFVYILSPDDLAWHLGSSLDRLLLQLWPLAIFTYFMVVHTPEQV